MIETKNISEYPEDSFEIDPAELIRSDIKIVGTWHTHPEGTCNLSHADYAGFLQWPDLDHWIIGPDGLRRYYVDDGVVVSDS